MHRNEDLISKFYSSFGLRAFAGMIACYAPNIEFSDAVFTLRGKQVGAMWHMLCESGRDLEITFSNVQANDRQGKAHWEARYTFSATGRTVHNVIDAEFVFEKGAIVQHRDHFDFWRWSRMALGPSGLFLGWTPLVHNRVKRTAAGNLERFIARHPEYQ